MALPITSPHLPREDSIGIGHGDPIAHAQLSMAFTAFTCPYVMYSPRVILNRRKTRSYASETAERNFSGCSRKFFSGVSRPRPTVFAEVQAHDSTMVFHDPAAAFQLTAARIGGNDQPFETKSVFRTLRESEATSKVMARSAKHRLTDSRHTPDNAPRNDKCRQVNGAKYPQKMCPFYFLHFPLIGTRLV